MTSLESGFNGHKRALHFNHAPRRVVSLVPSLTESLFDLGLGEAVVGLTDYCSEPAEGVANLPRLGGPKNPRLNEIIALRPDLVLANWEENTRQTVEALEAAGIPVWVTFPQSARETLAVLYALASLFRSATAALKVKTLEATLEWALSATASHEGVPYFCPIWQDTTQGGKFWWMTFNRHTYCHDVLAICGGVNIFAERERRYPLAADLGLAPPRPAAGRDVRYPRVTLEEIVAGQPQVIILPDEPYPYSAEHSEQMHHLLAETPAVRHGRVYCVTGSLITWAGTRLARALRELPPLFQPA